MTITGTCGTGVRTHGKRFFVPRVSSLLSFYFFLILFASSATFLNKASAQGVAVIDALEEVYLNLETSEVNVSVEDQVAVINSTQGFRNTLTDSSKVTFAFPLPESASPIGIRWFINGVWYRGAISEQLPDSTISGGGGGGTPTKLDLFLGETPMFFEIEQSLARDSLLLVELEYVQLLPYSFGNVEFVFPNKYTPIQSTPIESQVFKFGLKSQRTIESIQLLSHFAGTKDNTGNNAVLSYETSNKSMEVDYKVQYSLSLEELGLFGFSTWLSDSLVADNGSNGFFTFIAEPDPNDNAEVIDKVFTLIVDRSGSMNGEKMTQARDAASFVVNNLNDGDYFNIVDFSTTASSFQPAHVPANAENRAAALAYISGFRASGSTHISEAFSKAIPQFAAVSANTANLMVFFTDGMATIGITDTDGILTHVADLVASTETNPSIFTFGIGPDVDTQLLTLLAASNNGEADFLGASELEDKITQFFLRVNNPVLINTSVSFNPTTIEEVFPDPLPNLYQGQQMIVSGRYSIPGPVTITIHGEAFGQPVEFDYMLELTDNADKRYQFLTKVWAKQKMEDLLVEYYSLPPGSDEAGTIKDEVILLSVAFGIISPFTSFRGGEEEDDDTSGAVNNEEEEDGRVTDATGNGPFQILGNYPNPFSQSTQIRLQVAQVSAPVLQVRIYDTLGRLVRTLRVTISAAGTYEIEWDGLSDAGASVPSGTYLAVIQYGDAVLSHTMTVVR